MKMTPREVVNELGKIRFNWEEGGRQWTRRIFEHFLRLAEKKKLKVAVNPRYWGKETYCIKNGKLIKGEEGLFSHYAIKIGKKRVETPGEYLVDLCLYKEEPYKVELAMEIEWDPCIRRRGPREEPEPDWDFWKLVDVKAPLKVWISIPHKTGKRRYNTVEEDIKLLSNFLKSAELEIKNEEKYLIALFPRTKKDGVIHGYAGSQKQGLKPLKSVDLKLVQK